MPPERLPEHEGETDLFQLRHEDVLVTDGLGTGSVGVKRRVHEVHPKFLTKTTVAVVFGDEEIPVPVSKRGPRDDALRVGDDPEEVPTGADPALDLSEGLPE